MEPIISGDLRIVLLGMTGAGKSGTGNTILGRDEFRVDFNPESVTQQSEKKETRKGRRNVSVIDTPGLKDSKEKDNKVQAEIKRCMDMSSPGPHVFLLVIRLDERFTEEKMNTVKWIQKNFGEEAARFTFVLFTHADSLRNRPLNDHIEDSPDLRRLIISCGGRYHAVNNEDKMNQAQVNELLLKIDQMVLKNEGRHYTNMMHYKAQARLNWWKVAIAAIAVLAVVLAIAAEAKAAEVREAEAKAAKIREEEAKAAKIREEEAKAAILIIIAVAVGVVAVIIVVVQAIARAVKKQYSK